MHYAVRGGRKPGVYSSPIEAQAHCKGVSGAVMQSFRVKANALAFVAAVGAPPAQCAGKYSYYAVRVGVRPGLYGSNAEAQLQVQRVPGALYKGFHSKEAAEAFVNGGRSVPAASSKRRRADSDA